MIMTMHTFVGCCSSFLMTTKYIYSIMKVQLQYCAKVLATPHLIIYCLQRA